RRVLQVTMPGYSSRLVTGLELSDGQRRELDIALTRTPGDKNPPIEYSGIGARLRVNTDGSVAIAHLTPGAPGASAGLRAGDTILRVDGEDASTLGVNRVIARILGEEGSTVVLLVRRPGDDVPFQIPIQRARVLSR